MYLARCFAEHIVFTVHYTRSLTIATAAAAERLPMQLLPVAGDRQRVLQHLFLLIVYNRDI